MKKLLVLVMLFFSVSMSAQVTIEKIVDEMTDKIEYYSSHVLLSSNEDNTQGFTIEVVLETEGDKLYSHGWIVKIYNLGDCNEDNEIIILFEDGSSVTVQSFNQFKCQNVSYFQPTMTQEAMISTKKIKKVRFTNGYTYDRYTGPAVNPNFFIDLYDAIETFNQ